jgi:myo-inositol-1(or 4)-monophosphatase
MEDLIELARGAGEILRRGYETHHAIAYKSEIDLVTEVDRQSEEWLLQQIGNRFPGHQVLAEETGGLSGDDAHLWFVDPLDGTVNYAHGVPIFCVSLAYARRGELTLAAIYDPMRDECFSAERGRGALLNGHPIHVSETTDLNRSLLVTGFPYDIRTTPQNNLDNYARFALRSQGVRRLGAAALDLCYVAAGRFDGYWELSLKPWDVAAGILIAREAGAHVTTVDGNPDPVQPPCSVLAATPGIYDVMLAVLREKDAQ